MIARIDSIVPHVIDFTLIWPNGLSIAGTFNEHGVKLETNLRWNMDRGLILLAAMRAHPDYGVYEHDLVRRSLKQTIKFYEDRGWDSSKWRKHFEAA